jgi:hypothetical protein
VAVDANETTEKFTAEDTLFERKKRKMPIVVPQSRPTENAEAAHGSSITLARESFDHSIIVNALEYDGSSFLLILNI